MRRGRCPFHDERTPSFWVDPLKKVYFCFGCQASGDAIGFIRETESLDFTGAIEWLDSGDPDVISFRSSGVTVVANTGAGSVPLPAGRVLVSSEPIAGQILPGDTTVWVLAE